MQRSLADGAGFLEINHQDSPGLSPADVAHMPGAMAVGAGQVLERDIKQCSHCQRGVVLNPGRVRNRAVCLKCYRFICDSCEAIRVKTGACVPFKQVLDRAADIAEKFASDPTHPDADLTNPDALRVQNPTVSVPADVRPRVVLTDRL
jgi:hypothetical protein